MALQTLQVAINTDTNYLTNCTMSIRSTCDILSWNQPLANDVINTFLDLVVRTVAMETGERVYIGLPTDFPLHCNRYVFGIPSEHGGWTTVFIDPMNRRCELYGEPCTLPSSIDRLITSECVNRNLFPIDDVADSGIAHVITAILQLYNWNISTIPDWNGLRDRMLVDLVNNSFRLMRPSGVYGWSPQG